jgi:hypothetical protein
VAGGCHESVKEAASAKKLLDFQFAVDIGDITL